MKTYTLYQAHRDPRSGQMFGTSFGEFQTLREAKAEAKKTLKNCHWYITESKMVEQSESLSLITGGLVT